VEQPRPGLGQERRVAPGLPPGHPAVAALARKEHIYLDTRFSDHAPLTIDYDFSL